MSRPNKELLEIFRNYFKPLGLEIHFFQTSWYNEVVDEPFKFSVSDETVCAVLISVPSFFEDTFLPYARTVEIKNLDNDPIDSCMAYHVTRFQNYFNEVNMTVMYDYELLPNRRPKVLVQTAAHVAGAAFYYQQKHVTPTDNADCCKPAYNMSRSAVEGSSLNKQSKQNVRDCPLLEEKDIEISSENKVSTDPWGKKRIFGCCIHPIYGGWFAIRSVIIFSDIKNTDSVIAYAPPVDCVPTREDRIELLNRFNGNWQDWTYRDIIRAKECYSDIQKFYFTTLPKDRKNLLLQFLSTS